MDNVWRLSNTMDYRLYFTFEKFRMFQQNFSCGLLTRFEVKLENIIYGFHYHSKQRRHAREKIEAVSN